MDPLGRNVKCASCGNAAIRSYETSPICYPCIQNRLQFHLRHATKVAEWLARHGPDTPPLLQKQQVTSDPEE